MLSGARLPENWFSTGGYAQVSGIHAIYRGVDQFTIPTQGN